MNLENCTHSSLNIESFEYTKFWKEEKEKFVCAEALFVSNVCVVCDELRILQKGDIAFFIADIHKKSRLNIKRQGDLTLTKF